MLVYIAVDSSEDVLCPISEENIPKSLSSRFCEEQSIDERKRKEKDSAHEFTTVNLLLAEDFNGFEVCNYFLCIHRLEVLGFTNTGSNVEC